MLEIQREDGAWVTFHPIQQLDIAGEGDILSTLPLMEQPENVYGRYAGGNCGYSVWWVYNTVHKSTLREKK